MTIVVTHPDEIDVIHLALLSLEKCCPSVENPVNRTLLHSSLFVPRTLVSPKPNDAHKIRNGSTMTTNTTSDSQEEKTSKMDEDEGANAESSSTGSSDGKEGGSGSGGYSADCSASDQSSDENGKKNGSSRGAASEQGAVVDMDNDDEDDDDEAASTSDSKKQPPSGKPRDEALRDEPPSREDSKRSHRTTKFLNGEQDVASAAGQSKTASAASSGRSSAALPLSLDKMDLESILQYDPKKEIEEFANDPVFKQKQPVQWNGIRIAHPMDPRIDLSTVGHVRTQSVPLQHADGKSDEIDYGTLASVEKYRQLMEVGGRAQRGRLIGSHSLLDAQIVRPFFQPYGVALPLAPPQGVDLEELNQNSGSSEGFTSFFTTTHTSAGGTTTSGSKGSTSTEANKKPAARSTHNEDEMHSDDASMAVLARAKKKHQKKRQGSSNEESSANQSSSDRKVRIQQPRDPDRERMRPPEPQQGNDTSNSSSSASIPRLENAVDNDRVPPRIVTDMSSNPATDSNVGNSSTSATNSGSNQGSSGSGNDGKGSSEELANNEDISGESPEGSDSAENVAGAEVARRGQAALRQADVLGGSSDHALLDDPMDEDTSEAVRERKILDKKRKRIEMRREYEAQQQFESSESSRNSRQSDTLFVPGRPVTLDQVMMVSQIPR